MKKRKDSFWGIHCDYHAQPWMGTVGKTLCEDDIRKICRELKPDFWQIDCKGHFGYATYPTKCGNAMPDFAFDTLEMWRRVTREEGVALYMHYSGVWDEKYCREHPEARALRSDGSYCHAMTYRASKYVDDLLIPQICELAEKYEVDGIWLDGECWASEIDYHPETVEGFIRETGIELPDGAPKNVGDPYFEEYRNYNRELFRRYVRHYVDTIHEKYPDLQLTSNWIFSIHMPEPVSAGVDFLSGDNMPSDSLFSARYVSRYMPQQNMPWDIMGMGQRYASKGVVELLPEHPVQVMQQAAAVISLGGAFQVGLSQLFDGSPNTVNLLSLKEVAEFMKAREPFCFKGRVIPQAAMLISTYDRYLESDRLFVLGDIDSKRGLTALLCDSGQSFELVSEHSIKENINRFAMLVVPETIKELHPDTVKLLLDYARDGGNLVLVGTKTCEIFASHGAPFTVGEIEDNLPEGRFLCQQNEPKDQRFWYTDGKTVGGVMYPKRIVPTGEHEVVAHLCYSIKTEKHPFAVIMPWHSGKIAAIGADLGTEYNKSSQYLHRDLMKLIAGKLYTPLARIERSLGHLEIVCLEKNGRLMLQLVNGNGNHNNINCSTEDFIPPVVDIRISVATDRAPEKILLQPDGRELAFEYKNGRAYFDIDRVYIHSIAEIVK
ncbi:MAG: alpha-L-fucosidase [Clostridia bacterium]|nr:alpha-L-fucosidase [Clostridia bacterium]